jgi:GR25 family glycosyltransferase involved in LPS biosynthesis
MNSYFDQVYCINLSRCPDRKSHMINEFSKIGLSKYTFIEAIDSNDPIVLHAYQSGLVFKSPPCFRCKKFVCDHPNKKLLPSQIGNWHSFMKVWKDIIEKGYQKCLICEDDLVFMPYTHKVLETIFNPANLKKYNINFELPTLLRLGWLKSNEHKLSNIEFKNVVKMSNPCHMITLEMAKKLLDNLKIIDTTSDIYIHDIIGKTVNNYSIFPPIAYELSYGQNSKFASEIIPKKHFLNKLEKDIQNTTNPQKKLELKKKLSIEQTRFNNFMKSR